ncbi:MAG TPA: phage portal protein, partial [Clostridia bacterium]|nr:phage portal protein [Clostridia bacterium]
MEYVKEFHMDQEEEMTSELLEEFIQQHRTLVLRYEELDRMYRGIHPILRMAEKALFKPDNRLVVNYAKFIVDTFNGFFMGAPVKVTSDREEVAEYIRL